MTVLKRKFIWLMLSALVGLGVLIGLGSWQLQRLAWKQELLATIEARTRLEPSSLRQALHRWSQSRDVEYLPVRLTGSFDHKRERHVYAILKGQPGWRIVTPFSTTDGGIVMVDRGFVPDRLKHPGSRADGQIEGEITVTGLARAPGGGNAFTPPADPLGNMWYWRDLDGMAASILPAAERERLAPFFVEARESSVPGGWPKGGVTRLDLPNRHLEYALTWFGLALGLLLVYAALVRKLWLQGEFT